MDTAMALMVSPMATLTDTPTRQKLIECILGALVHIYSIIKWGDGPPLFSRLNRLNFYTHFISCDVYLHGIPYSTYLIKTQIPYVLKLCPALFYCYIILKFYKLSHNMSGYFPMIVFLIFHIHIYCYWCYFVTTVTRVLLQNSEYVCCISASEYKW